MIPLSCATSSASAICRAMASACPSGSPPPFACATRERLRERARPRRARESGSGRPRLPRSRRSRRCWVVQRREHPRLALEAREPIRVARECRGRILIATSRPSFASCARYTSPMPPAPSSACSRYPPSEWPVMVGGRGRRGLRRRRERGCARNPSSDDSASSDSTSRRSASSSRHASARNAARSPVGRARGVIQLFGPLPAFRRHHGFSLTRAAVRRRIRKRPPPTPSPIANAIHSAA